MVASALCVLRSRESTTWAPRSSLPSSSLPILANRASSFCNLSGASSTCLPVYVIFMEHLVGAGNIPFLRYHSNSGAPLAAALVAHAPLMSGRNLHVLAVFGHGAARDVDTPILKHGCDLLVGEGLGAILLFDHFLHSALQQEERCTPAQRPLDRFREEIAELEDALRRMHIFAGHGAAHGGGMHPYLLRHFLDHHGLQTIQPVAEEFGLAPHDGLADLEDGLLALLDILHQLDGRRVALADVIPDFLGGAVLAIQHLAVLGVQAKLRDILIVHLNDVIVAILGEEDVRLHHARSRARVA